MDTWAVPNRQRALGQWSSRRRTFRRWKLRCQPLCFRPVYTYSSPMSYFNRTTTGWMVWIVPRDTWYVL
jgi:hypothetical protein